ncbi:hypothetical protein [Roseibium algicola]|nr:hypothetical protein [Roseibium aggregatum]
MTGSDHIFNGMSLYSLAGERKYLSAAERERFYRALPVLSCPEERTFVE